MSHSTTPVSPGPTSPRFAVKEGVTPEEIRNNVSWDLKFAPDVKVIEPPTVEQIEVLRVLDANKIFIGNGLANLSFENYMKYLNDMGNK